jgi:hypothetical protein
MTSTGVAAVVGVIQAGGSLAASGRRPTLETQSPPKTCTLGCHMSRFTFSQGGGGGINFLKTAPENPGLKYVRRARSGTRSVFSGCISCDCTDLCGRAVKLRQCGRRTHWQLCRTFVYRGSCYRLRPRLTSEGALDSVKYYCYEQSEVPIYFRNA